MAIIVQDSNNTQSLENNIIKLTDANNKVIEVKIDDINDASTYLSETSNVIYDSNNQNINFSCAITDSEGNSLTEDSLIADVKAGKINALDVTFEATHSGRNLNNAVYVSESMAADSNSFMFPYAKPLIKNHDNCEEPLGRVIAADFDKSEFVEDRDTINVTFRVSDQDAMLKFADGRYKTMSIGATAKNIKCNVCGKDILKDNKFKFCGHWKGERYADQVATWTMTNMSYKEGSVVNQPADVYAQVKRMKVIKAKGDSSMPATKDGLEDVDNILGTVSDTEQGTEPVNPTPVEDSTTKTTTEEVTDLEKVQAELQAAKDEIEELKANHAKEIEAKDSEIETLKAEKLVQDSELVERKNQVVRLAKLNKQLLVDNVKALNSDINDEEIADKSAQELNQMILDLRSATPAEKQQREIPVVNNPGVAVKDNHTVIEDENEDEKTSKETTYTMKDMEAVVEKLFKVN